MKLCSFHECAMTANAEIEKGATIYQKFQCEKCGTPQHMETPNAFYTFGKCEECGHVTDILNNGCNYLLVVEGKRAWSYLQQQLNKNNPVQEV